MNRFNCLVSLNFAAFLTLSAAGAFAAPAEAAGVAKGVPKDDAAKGGTLGVVLRRGLGSQYWQSRGFPARNPAGNFTYAIESVALQQTRRNRRPVTSRTVDQQGSIRRQRAQFFRKLI